MRAFLNIFFYSLHKVAGNQADNHARNRARNGKGNQINRNCRRFHYYAGSDDLADVVTQTANNADANRRKAKKLDE